MNSTEIPSNLITAISPKNSNDSNSLSQVSGFSENRDNQKTGFSKFFVNEKEKQGHSINQPVLNNNIEKSTPLSSPIVIVQKTPYADGNEFPVDGRSLPHVLIEKLSDIDDVNGSNVLVVDQDMSSANQATAIFSNEVMSTVALTVKDKTKIGLTANAVNSATVETRVNTIVDANNTAINIADSAGINAIESTEKDSIEINITNGIVVNATGSAVINATDSTATNATDSTATNVTDSTATNVTDSTATNVTDSTATNVTDKATDMAAIRLTTEKADSTKILTTNINNKSESAIPVTDIGSVIPGGKVEKSIIMSTAMTESNPMPSVASQEVISASRNSKPHISTPFINYSMQDGEVNAEENPSTFINKSTPTASIKSMSSYQASTTQHYHNVITKGKLNHTNEVKMSPTGSSDLLSEFFSSVETEGLGEEIISQSSKTVRSELILPYQHSSVATPSSLLTNVTTNTTPSLYTDTSVPIEVGKPGWGNAVMEKVMWMSSQQMSRAEIALDPPELGPLNVRIISQQDQTSVVFSSNHGVVRDALDQGISKLREMMDDQGLNLVDVNVSDQNSHNGKKDNLQNDDDLVISRASNDSDPLTEITNEDEEKTKSQISGLVDQYI